MGGLAYNYAPQLIGEAPPPVEEVQAGGESIPTVEGAAADEVVDAPTQPAAADEAAGLIAPNFDLIRVEPNGEMMAAGRAAPQAGVELWIAGEEFVAEVSNSDGEWTAVPASPLPVGEHEIVLRATGANGEGGPIEGDRATVIIPEADGLPVIAIARPGEPSQVVPQPEELALAEAENGLPNASRHSAPATAGAEPVEGNEPDTLAALPGTAPSAVAEPESEVTREAVAVPAEVAPSPGEVDAAPEAAVAQASGDEARESGIDSGGEAALPETGAGEAETVAAADAGAPSPVRSGGPPVADETERRPEAETTSEAGETPAPAGAEQAVAALTPEDEEDSAAESSAPQVSIESIEVTRDDRVILSGQGEPFRGLRVSVNDVALDTVEAAGQGGWRAAGEVELPPGRYVARAEIVDGDGEVIARASLRFDRMEITLSDAAPAEAAAPETMTASEPPVAPEEGAAPDSAALGAPVLRTETTEAREGQPLPAAEAPDDPPASTRVSADEVPEEALSAGPALPEGPRTADPVETARDPQPEMTVVIVDDSRPAATPEASMGVMTEAINIKRGDNLWRIARAIYGQGVKYELIYEANRSQIENPHLIFPGQVFTIPLPDEPAD